MPFGVCESKYVYCVYELAQNLWKKVDWYWEKKQKKPEKEIHHKTVPWKQFYSAPISFLNNITLICSSPYPWKSCRKAHAGINMFYLHFFSCLGSDGPRTSTTSLWHAPSWCSVRQSNSLFLGQHQAACCATVFFLHPHPFFWPNVGLKLCSVSTLALLLSLTFLLPPP